MREGLPSAFRATCWAALILSTLSAALTLDVNSFWLDEIFTAFVAEARRESWTDLLRFLGSDTNPPGYFFLVNMLDRLFTGDVHLWSRGLSLLCATAALAVLYAAPSEELSAEARLFGVAYASTTTVWYEFAPMARSYALVFLFVAIMAFAYFRIRRAATRGETSYRWYAVFVASAVTAALLNYYALLLAGGLVGALVLTLGEFRQPAIAAASGGLILAIIAPVLLWQLSAERIIEFENTWFRSDARFILYNLRLSITAHIDGFATPLFWGGMIGLLCLGVIQRSLPAGAVVATLRFIAPLAMAVVFVAVSGILITVLATPIFQAKTVLVAAQLIWLCMMAVAAPCLRNPGAWTGRLAMVASIVFLIFASGKMALRDQAFQSPYREIARTIQTSPNCENADIPFLSGDWAFSRYEANFYLPNPMVLAPRPDLRSDRLPPSVVELARQRFADPSTCGVLMWNAHDTEITNMQKVRSLLEKSLPPPVGRRMNIRIVVPSEPSELEEILRPIYVRRGHILLLE